MLKRIALCLIFTFALCSVMNPALAAPVTPNSFHFQAVPNSSITCAGSTSASTQTFAAGSAANAPDVKLVNTGTVSIYFEVYAASSPVTASASTSEVLGPGEADLHSKYQADSISCITASGTGSIVATPGTGN